MKKKFISLVLAAALAVTAIPTTAFAAASTKVSRRPTLQIDQKSGHDDTGSENVQGSQGNPGNFANNAPYMVFELDTKTSSSESFKVQLTNAEWAFDFKQDPNKGDVGDDNNDTIIFNTDKTSYEGKLGQGITKITSLTDKTILVELMDGRDADVWLPLNIKGTDVGTIEARVYDGTSVLEGTYNVGYVGETSTSVTVADTVNFSNKATVKNILIEETAPGSFKAGTITVSVGGNFKIPQNGGGTIKLVRPTASGDLSSSADKALVANGVSGKVNSNGTEVTFELGSDQRERLIKEDGGSSTVLGILQISGLEVQEDDAASGDAVNLTVRGSGVERTTLEVGSYIEFDVDIKAENKELPTFYAGQVANEENQETLKVTLKELVPNSWWAGRKTTIEAPDGVKFDSVEIKNKSEKVQFNDTKKTWLGGGSAQTFYVGHNADNITFDADKITFSNLAVKDDDKAEIEFKFELSIDPGFTGDVDLVFGGPALEADTSVTVAKAVQPVTITAEANPVSIDYRKVPVTDITIKENYAGALKTDKKIVLGIEDDLIGFDSGSKIEYEVTEGDIKIDKVKVDGSNIVMDIKTASGKTPSTIKLSGLSLYLSRDLPQGDYALQLKEAKIGDDGGTHAKGDSNKTVSAIFRSYTDKEDDNKALFDTDAVDVIDNYITVVTQGRDKDDSTFATKVVVTINSTTMSVNGEEKTIPVAPYIRDGRTMVPVRAITEALATSSNAEPVQWIDSARTVVIYYGSRIITMKLGEAQMTINGSPIPMNVAPEIVNDYTFIPLRDLGTALGLTDAQIVWDEAAQTVTFN